MQYMLLIYNDEQQWESIPEDERLPEGNRVAGTEVHGKVRCGNHPMGYSLFYGLWEFLYEKVVFFF